MINLSRVTNLKGEIIYEREEIRTHDIIQEDD